jgi:UDP-N-acetyl-D-mannosaminuronic acid dehydrogenase
MFRFDVCVVGGCGRVGLPLAIAFADKGLNVVVHDLDREKLGKVRTGVMPFREEGCQEKLQQVLNRTLLIGDGPACVSESRFIIVTIGTPVDKHLNPDFSAMLAFFRNLLPHLVSDQHIILRSTVYPGTADKVHRFLEESGANVHLAFCPERILEGKALSEFATLPQIVSAFDEECVQAVSDLFRMLTPDIVVVNPIEAELAKLFTNTWRYIQFSIANQFFLLANDYGLDYYRIHNAVTYKYPRAQNLPKPGFTAGPCLFKDTMQLAAFSNNSFFLGHAAMLVNEGLPNYIVQRLKARMDLSSRNVGILGMAFKANSDDERDSLSFKLKALLEVEAKKVCCTDPYVRRDYFVSPDELLNACEVIILATPHEDYRKLHINEDKTLVDVWNFYGRGVII